MFASDVDQPSTYLMRMLQQAENLASEVQVCPGMQA